MKSDLRTTLQADYPENQGLSSRTLMEFFDQAEAMELGVNTLVLLRNGRKMAEFYRRPYRKGCPQLLFSLTKMITSAAVGIAIDAGFFGLDDPVISFFPERPPRKVTPNLEKMTVHHLLAMNTGHHDHNYHTIYKQKDWVQGFLDIPPEHEPGTHYCYSTHGSFVLAAIVERTTGQRMVHFLMPRLFAPLGIAKPSWEAGPQGITAGGMGLSLPTEAVAKFGQMFLDGGVYRGQRILSKEYIRLATQKHSDTRSSKDAYDNYGYGYHVQLYRQECFGHVGSFGQLCFVSPQHRVVVAATSGKRNFTELFNLIYAFILNKPENAGSAISSDCSRLQRRLANITPLLPDYVAPPSAKIDLTNRSYNIEENPEGLEQLDMSLQDDVLHCTFRYAGRKAKAMRFGLTQPVRATDVFIKDISLHKQEVLLQAWWQGTRTLKLTMVYIETPYVGAYVLSFDGEKLTLHFGMNVSLGAFSPLSRKAYTCTGVLKTA